MTTSVGNYGIELKEIAEQGKFWIVRTYKRTFLFKKFLSSDWFLDEKQAQTFAKQLAERISGKADVAAIKMRKPGWTLVRPAR